MRSRDEDRLGVVYRRQGDHDQALAFQQEELAIRRDLGDLYERVTMEAIARPTAPR